MTSIEIFSLPMFCLTPLYHFSSDVPDLTIDQGIRVSRFNHNSTISFDDAISNHLRVHEPDYLLWHNPLVSGEVVADDVFPLLSKRKWAEFTEHVLSPASRLFELMRLFKPGRLRAGETFVCFRKQGDNLENWTTVSSGRASMMAVDYSLLMPHKTSYFLNSDEVPLFLAFRHNVVPILQNISAFPTLTAALFHYGQDNGEQTDLVGAITAFEALLTKREETEGLTYRLSMRIANLLGHGVDDRKAIFREVKNFYNLRSKIVHGARLDAKLLGRLNELDSLREILRKVLLSVMALSSEGTRPTELPDLLDDLAFDDEERKHLQARASRFQYASAEETGG